MKVKKRNFITYFFFFTVIALENFSWLIPVDLYIIPGIIKFSDIGVISAIIWSLCVFVKYIYSKRNSNYRPIIWPALFFIVAIVSSFSAKKFFGQSLAMSFRQVRYLLVCFVYFYAIFICLRVRSIKKEDVYTIIKFQALIECLLYILQTFLIDQVEFIHVGATFEYTNIRLRVSFLMPLIFMYISLDAYMKGENKKKNIIYFLLGAYVLIGVCQHRAPSIIMICTWCIAFILWKKGTSKKFLVFVVGTITIVAFVSSSEIMQQAIGVVFKGSSKGDTLTIRQLGRMYYFQRLKDYNAWITGFGQANINCDKAYIASGALNYIYMVDNGIFGFLYCYGIIGIIWIISFFVNLFKMSLYLLKKCKCYHFLLYILFEVGNMYMGLHWFYYYTAPFIIYIALLNWEYYENKILEKAKKYDK